MSSVPSASTWGPLTATKHALLIHGLSSSSHTWHRVASLLAAQGYSVTAPNLVGHGSRISESMDYRLSNIAQDLLPYLETKTYCLIIGHSLGAATVLSLFPYLPRSNPVAVLLVDPPMQQTDETLDFLDILFTNACVNVKPAEIHATENTLWSRQDSIYMELGTRLCSVEAVHGIWRQNRPWYLFNYLNQVPDKWKVTVVVADPVINKLCTVEDIQPYPHVRAVMVPGAGHWIQYEFPNVIVEEALKRVAELDVAV